MVNEPDPPVSFPVSSVPLSQLNKSVPSSHMVASYLHETIGELWLYREQPTVRIVTDAPLRFKPIVRQVIDGINAWLPYEQHLVLGTDIQALSPTVDVPVGEIWIGTATFPDTAHLGSTLGRSYTSADNRAQVEVNASLSPDWSAEQLYGLLLHEILHTLGLGHVNPATYPDSIMAAHGLPAVTIYSVPKVDGVGLMAAYTRLPSGILTKDIDPDHLGPWASEVAVFQGELSNCDCAFGTDWINGMAVPWIDGAVTTRTFAESGLRGTVTWDGKVVGWTPDQATVSGDTALAVNLGTLTGTADFTNLAFYDDQSQWGDGDLGYSVSLSGNYFRSTPSDDPGYVSGKFVGEQHDGALGILEHPDLTGAFGAKR
ncbi:MAG: hypothetical protein OXL95_09555 [Nitrospira sp.]|nr:hypothetical protein [Nitrospira sp.]MDE0485870.1 hypothetical protein [Nitrospira sp.]